MSTIRGLNAAVQNRTRIRYTDAGNDIEEFYIGPTAQVVALISSLRSHGYEVEIVSDSSPLSTLTATLPQGEAAGRTGDITDTNNATGLFTAPAHELITGDVITITGIVGVSSVTEWFVRFDTLDTFYIYDTQAHAYAGGATGLKLPTDNDDTGSFTRQESPTPRWEMFNQDRPVSILKARIPSLGAHQLTDNQKKVLKKVIDQGVDVLTQEETEEVILDPNNATDKTNLYNEIAYDGVTEIIVSVFTLSVSRTVSGLQQIFDAATGSNQLFSTTYLTTYEGVPPEQAVNLPAFTGPPARKVYGWKKNFPRIEFIGGGRVVINQTWDYDLWSAPAVGNTPPAIRNVVASQSEA